MRRTPDLEPASLAAAPQRRPTRRFEQRRRAILASAVAELNRKGIRGMTLGDVAARLNLVSTGVIYYFKNKEDLAEAAFLAAIERFDAFIDEAASEPSPRARLARFVRAFFAFKRDVALGEAEQIALFNDVRALNSDAVNAAYVAMFRRARRLIDPDRSTAASPMHRNARAHLLLSEVFWAVAWLKGVLPPDYDRNAARFEAILCDGLAAPGVAWPARPPLDLPIDVAARSEASELFLRAATKLINAEGYHGASVDRISAELNLSKGSFYHHNATKDDLVVACFRRTFDLMWRAIWTAEAQGGTGLQTLTAVCSMLIRHQFGGGAPLLRTSALTTVPEGLQHDLMADFDRLSSRFAAVLCDGVADGSIRPVDVNIAAQMITGMVNAAAELHFWAPGLTVQTATDHYMRPLFLGLTGPPAG